MQTNYLYIILAVVPIVVIGVLLAFAFIPWQRTRRLKKKFGPEYDQVVSEMGNRQQAERDLAERNARVQKLQIRPLYSEETTQFKIAWMDAQSDFVNHPAKAVEEAHLLINRVLSTRGYPTVEFYERAGNISVDYPELVASYRLGSSTRLRNHQTNEVSTEDLRNAFINYRRLFEELVKPVREAPPEPNPDPAVRIVDRLGDRA